ncbi:MAG: hypothetical protein QOI21_1504 [Actinomycetota bacterium]|jgi:NAD(P)-dependent dehydrogenase (short-subunit alcohol dehydrogenase family)|nr:hypothetical protein [Actinomycetota bacterium]
MSRICEGRVVIVTGGGRGLGRAHAQALATEGAIVVVNDRGLALDGGTTSAGSPADTVVAEIRKAGGQAIASADDISSWDGAGRLVESAIATFGRLDALVCNAGNLVDRELADMSQQDWESVVSTHLNGHAAPLHHAAKYWRALATKTGDPAGGRVVLTTSTAGVWGDGGRANYNSAKAGIILLGRTAAIELAHFGATVNIIAPFARTRMTISLDAELAKQSPGPFDRAAPENISPLVVWLCSENSADVTGEVFEIHAGRVGLIEQPRRGPHIDHGGRWDPAELGDAIKQLLESR